MAEQEKQRLMEKKMKEEEERRLVEEEMIRKHREERRLGKGMGEDVQRLAPASSASSLAESDSEAERRKRSRDKGDSPEKMKKKRVESEEDEDEVEFGDDPFLNVDLATNLLVGWLRQPTIQKMVTKPQQKKLQAIIDKVRQEVVSCRIERCKMQTMVEERGMLAAVVRTTVREELEKKIAKPAVGGSYAAVVGKSEIPKVPKITGVKGPVQPAPKLVIIKQDEKESEEVITKLKKLVKPSEIGLKVKKLTKIRNGVIVEAETEEGVENLIKHKALKDAGMKVGKPVKKRPVIMIYDVSTALKDKDIKEEVYIRNLQGCEFSEEEFEGEFEVRHKYQDVRSRGRRCHIVAECSVRVRNWLRAKEKVFIEWQSCRVKDYVDVARCYKCQRYGHIAKHCTSAKPACSYCAGEHDYKECPNKNKEGKVRCANCKREGRTEDRHDAGWRECPSYERAVKRQNEKIDYGL